MTIVIDARKYLKLKLEGAGMKIPPEILLAMSSSMKEGLSNEMSVADGLAAYNKTLPVEIFEDTGALTIKDCAVELKEKHGWYAMEKCVDLTNLEGYARSEQVVFF